MGSSAFISARERLSEVLITMCAREELSPWRYKESSISTANTEA
jgi:hypothetical protein